MDKNARSILGGVMCVVGAFLAVQKIAVQHTEGKDINEDNLYLKVDDKESVRDFCGHRATSASTKYEKAVKPAIDKILSFAGLVILSPLMLGIAVAVWIDDPGPVFFTQKRVGKDKNYFMLHKYRTMKMSTPHDVPTHMLDHPEQYITRIGRALRRTSLDELPQIWDIFRGKMSVIGPRPALWNQDDLVKNRDKYGANSVFPGLSGLAQIKGRDELLIADKAKLDGEYTAILRRGGFRAFFFDVRMFLGTLMSVMKHDGVVEGGTGNSSNSPEHWQPNQFIEKVCVQIGRQR